MSKIKLSNITPQIKVFLYKVVILKVVLKHNEIKLDDSYTFLQKMQVDWTLED